MFSLLVAVMPACVVAHGRITIPANRQGGELDTVGDHNCRYSYDESVQHHLQNMCGYMSRIVNPPNWPPTVCDKKYLTTTFRFHKNGGCDNKNDGKYTPWRRPGTAPVWSSCGYDGGYKKGDKDFEPCKVPGWQDGTALPQSKFTQWHRGDGHRAGFTITVNHGGGYIWRLCPAGRTPNEECFWEQVLEFSTDTTTVHFKDGTEKTFKALDMSEGTYPSKSTWRVNQIPCCGNNATAPCPGCYGDEYADRAKGAQDANWQFSLIDHVYIPANQPLGKYVLSWRWDNENQEQVWTNCADIEVVEAKSEAVV